MFPGKEWKAYFPPFHPYIKKNRLSCIFNLLLQLKDQRQYQPTEPPHFKFPHELHRARLSSETSFQQPPSCPIGS